MYLRVYTLISLLTIRNKLLHIIMFITCLKSNILQVDAINLHV